MQNVMTFSEDESGGEPAQPESSSLAQELAELRTLRAQLAALERDVYGRERWLADATGTAPPSGLGDCDGVVCVVQALLRKVRYAVELILTATEDSDDDLNRTIPLPPWRRPQNSTEGQEPPSLGSDPVDGGTDAALALAVLGVFGIFALLAVFGGFFYVVTACLAVCGARTVRGLHLPPPATAAGEASLGSACRGRVWFRVWWRRTGEGQGLVGLGDGDGDGHEDSTGDEYLEKTEPWDEKEGLVLEDDVVEGDSESDGESDSDGGGDNDGESDGDSLEGLTLGDEITSFRSALELVEGLIAETTARGR